MEHTFDKDSCVNRCLLRLTKNLLTGLLEEAIIKLVQDKGEELSIKQEIALFPGPQCEKH